MFIPIQPQRQDAAGCQLFDVIVAANRLGCYDAADWMRDRYPRVSAGDGEQTRRVRSLVEQQPQRQDTLAGQMATVCDAARALGCYDAEDTLRRHFTQ